MNFGYPNTPYANTMAPEGYMGNVGTNPGMEYMMGQGCGMQGCGIQGSGMQGYGQQGCNQVVQQTCAVDMPYYVNYNTHGNTN